MARQDRDRLDDDVDLAAEAAADRAADQAQLVERHLQDERGVVEGEEHRLGVGVAGEAAIASGTTMQPVVSTGACSIGEDW